VIGEAPRPVNPLPAQVVPTQLKAAKGLAANVAPASEPLPSAMVFTRDRDAEGIIRQCLTTLIPSAEFFNGTVDAAIAQLAQRASPRLLFVDVSGSSDPVAQIKNLSEVCEPGTGVIVIGDTNDIRLYRDLRQVGIVEYYFKPLVSALITRTASGILTGNVEQRGSSTGKLIIVIGVRGAVGATTIAASTAWHLAERHQRRVALLDLDMFAGDAALQLDAAPTHALFEALEHPERVDDLFLERATIHVTERLSLLASLENFANLMVPAEDAVLSLLGKLLRRYRYVFVDFPVDLVPRFLRVLHLPGICLLVSNATLVSARDLMRWREIIGPSSTERQVLHILNEFGAAGGLSQAEFLRATGEAPDITIPFDRTISASSSMGVKAVLKCAALQRGLAPLFSLIAGEAAQAGRSLAERIMSALLRRP
jgi:pilus assembly protein CpaE